MRGKSKIVNTLVAAGNIVGPQRKVPTGKSFMEKMTFELGLWPVAKEGRNSTPGRGNNV